MKTAIDTLKGMYLPGYVTIQSEDYDGKGATFDIKPVEIPVSRNPLKYLTPRGVHIIVSQGSYCFVENLAKEGKLDFDEEELKRVYFDFRLRLVEFNQRFRKELRLEDKLQGKMMLSKLRLGRIPILKMDFDLGNKAVSGNIIGMISPEPFATNVEIVRN